MSLTDLEREYLAGQRLGRLATVGPKGDPQNNPVGFRYNAERGTIDVRGYNLAQSRKYRNLRDNDQVAFVVDDLASITPWRVRGIEIRGRAETAVEDTGQEAHVTADVIRIHPRTVFTWGLDPDTDGMIKRVID
ncbi:PPOX class F420-dependent oxidoreductase [Actinomadura madurae]|uniref:PPOX class F420-dependent oxidoreductase n=1 Tax=Actinomadura madurae TaxID=1993 RepID=UPI0020267FF7|nr:PPOX class F420-dependent oxidoreductase [Actinomadura madurae]MCP9948651.1 PPOX class F420-dependent oxidoreductase [Actinomadura madurae]MCP9965424.1 PPOX class F420-dependent oxidoreductase [Actinomadura madurae]MCP9977914.1 PPOX class F420-dependent oxidoreductase [Actinomadura madurae]MCQ0010585.1 PPOX class F420-dependent oxidoreductase [Actinomadura madurae]MCQ0014103.1 PPOX class F420-dependent oxidoreductase [Actinomadura madurae]